MRVLWPLSVLLVLAATAWVLADLRTAAPDNAPADSAPVVATTTIAADLVRQIAGNRIPVDFLMGPGVDPHQYRARESDLGRVLGARLVVIHGLHLEGRMARVLESLPHLGVPVVSLGDSLPPEEVLRNGEAPDPHVWMDVTLWSRTVTVVEEALARIDPPGAQEYRQRARLLSERLDALDAWVREQVETIPPGQRMLVTAHDAFAYFGRAYGLEVRGVQGLSTVTEAGARDIEALAEEVARRQVPALFVEHSLSPRLVQAVIRSAASRGHRVSLGGSLYSDSLGSPDSSAGTYEGMIRHNVETLVRGLVGTAALPGP